jgi:hypothetical protein
MRYMTTSSLHKLDFIENWFVAQQSRATNQFPNSKPLLPIKSIEQQVMQIWNSATSTGFSATLIVSQL